MIIKLLGREIDLVVVRQDANFGPSYQGLAEYNGNMAKVSSTSLHPFNTAVHELYHFFEFINGMSNTCQSDGELRCSLVGAFCDSLMFENGPDIFCAIHNFVDAEIKRMGA